MAETDIKTDSTTSSSGSNGGATGGSASGSGGSATDSDTNSGSLTPQDTPVAASGNGNATDNQNTEEAAEGMARTMDAPKKEAQKEEDMSLSTAFNKAREEGLLLGIKDARSLDEYAASVGTKKHDGQAYSPVEEVRKTAGDMAAAIAQFKMESNLATKVGLSDHANVGNGLYAGKQRSNDLNLSTTA